MFSMKKALSVTRKLCLLFSMAAAIFSDLANTRQVPEGNTVSTQHTQSASKTECVQGQIQK